MKKVVKLSESELLDLINKIIIQELSDNIPNKKSHHAHSIGVRPKPVVKPTTPIVKPKKVEPLPVSTPPQSSVAPPPPSAPPPKQEPNDILMPDGTKWSKDKFIAKYGQQLWDKYTKRKGT